MQSIARYLDIVVVSWQIAQTRPDREFVNNFDVSLNRQSLILIFFNLFSFVVGFHSLSMLVSLIANSRLNLYVFFHSSGALAP